MPLCLYKQIRTRSESIMIRVIFHYFGNPHEKHDYIKHLFDYRPLSPVATLNCIKYVGRLLSFDTYFLQLMCLEEKLSPLVLSALGEDSQMARLLACRSMSTIIKLIGTRLHPEALNKIYPGK